MTFREYILKIVNSNLTEWGDINYYETLTNNQKGVVQALKRLAKRIKRKTT